MRMGQRGKDSRKQKNKSKKGSVKSFEVAPNYKNMEELSCLDVFAGCGGFSEGLLQSGVAKIRWAVSAFNLIRISNSISVCACLNIPSLR